jgi:predicted Fe-Mo cluster-binding NifX family protein
MSLIYFTIPVITYPIISSAIAIISAFAAALTALYLIRVGRNINSQLLIASGRERIGDIITSSSVLVSIILSFFYSLPLIEGIVTIVISILILRMGFSSLKDAVFALMDISLSKGIEEEIKKIVNDMEKIKNFENLKLRKSGPFIFGEIEIDIKKSINVEKAHQISESLKERIYDEIKEIQSFTVHIEPAKLSKYKMVIPIIDNEGLDSIISNHFGRAKEYIILEIEDKKILDYHSIKNPFVNKDKRAGLSAIKMLLKNEPIDILITYEMGEISYHTLSDHLIEVYNCSERLTVQEIFEKYKENKLKHLKRPTKEKELI